MESKTLKYELTEQVVNYLLNAVNRVQINWVQAAKDLLAVVEILQNPINKEDLDKETYEALKEKFEPKKKETK